MGSVGCFGQIENIRRQSLASIEGDERNVILTLACLAHLQSSVFKLSKDLIDSIHEEGIVAYTS